MRASIRAALVASAVLVLCLPFGSGAGACAAAREPLHGNDARGLRSGPGIPAGRRLSQAAAPRYTLHNLGAPPGYAFSAPVGFNNTGQIFGYVDLAPYGADCRVWTGSSFVRPPLPLPGTCTATGINDAVAGNYELVGYANLEFSYGNRAFSAFAGTGGFTRATVYYANSPSMMLAVNATGLSVASAQFSRDTVADYIGQLYFTTTPAQTSLAPLQAPATPNGPPIHNLIPFEFPCAFGGCVLNDDNEVLGYDELTVGGSYPTLAIYTYGKPASLAHLPVLSSGGGPGDVVDLNDRNELLYYDAARGEPVLFTIATGVRTILPVVPADCSTGFVYLLGLNNLGEVLGDVQNCGNSTFYFTWDPLHGVQNLSAQVPSSAYTLRPLGVNDRGQILTQLTDSAGKNYWGTLDPVAASAKRARAR